MTYHEHCEHDHRLRHHHHLTLLSLRISNPQVYPPSLFPYRWALQQEPDRGLKAISVQICKKWMIFFSCDFPVANPHLMLYFSWLCLFVFVCCFFIVIVVGFWFNWLVWCCCCCCFCCFVISLFFCITCHQTWHGGYCVHAFAKEN